LSRNFEIARVVAIRQVDITIYLINIFFSLELVKPTFGNVSEYDVISLKENDILHRELQATGYPKPDVHCKQKNTKPKKQYFKTNGNSITIHISKLKYSLHRNASFQCIAKNVKGSATWNISLNIWGMLVYTGCIKKLREFLNRS
jgi:hypothetical protein